MFHCHGDLWLFSDYSTKAWEVALPIQGPAGGGRTGGSMDNKEIAHSVGNFWRFEGVTDPIWWFSCLRAKKAQFIIKPGFNLPSRPDVRWWLVLERLKAAKA